MQTQTSKNSTGSTPLEAAVKLADQMAEKLRQDPKLAKQFAQGKIARAHGKDITCLKRRCTKAQENSAVLHNWSYDLNRLLTNGRGHIDMVSSKVTIKITYKDLIDAGAPEYLENQYVLSFKLGASTSS